MDTKKDFDNDAYTVDTKEGLDNEACTVDEYGDTTSNGTARPLKREELILDGLQYKVDDNPPVITTLFLALQHYLMLLSSNLATPTLIASTVCSFDPYIQSQLLGDMLFACGIGTLIQTSIGVRLPIVQCPAFAYIVPMITLTKIGKLKCPNNPEAIEAAGDNTTLINMLETSANGEPIFVERMNTLIGSIMVAGVIEIVIGASGLISILMRFIGPLSVAPTIMLMALPAAETGFRLSGYHWGISIGTMILIFIFSEMIPILFVKHPCSSDSERKVQIAAHKMMSVIIAVCLMWFLCFILTITDVFPVDPDKYGYQARTDTRLHIISDASWFRFPYPGHRGMPQFSSAIFVAMLAGVVTSIIESIGDYYTCARLAGALPPPAHAVNRGILIEGIDCILSASVGLGYGVTSCSQNIGIIDLTKVGSRRVVLVAGFFMAVLGCFGKFNSVIAALPDPITGGSFMVLFAVLTAVGASNLQYCNLNSSRNMAVFGMALFLGLGFPPWIIANEKLVTTGSEDGDQIIHALLANNMFVGSFTAILLDNVLPGTPEERGITVWQEVPHTEDDHHDDVDNGGLTYKTYDLPFVMRFIRRWSWPKYVPFMPGFKGFAGCKRGQASTDVDNNISRDRYRQTSEDRGTTQM